MNVSRTGPRGVGRAGSSILKLFTLFLAINALLYTLIGLTVVVPKLTAGMEELRQQDLEQVGDATTTHLNLYFEDRLKLIRDLSRVPHIVNAAVLSSAENPDLVDFMSNFAVLEDEAEVSIINVAGEVVYSTPDAEPLNFATERQWFDRLNADQSEAEFQLDVSSTPYFRYMIAVPIRYSGYVEGVLAVYLHGNMKHFTSGLTDYGAILKLCDDSHCVPSGALHSEHQTRVDRDLVLPGLRIEVLFDWTLVDVEYKQVSQSILMVMWAAAAGGFLIFAALGYRILVRPYQRLREQRDQLAMLRAAMENAVEGVSRLDENGCYDDLNDAYAALCGYEPAELLGQPWYITVAREEKQAAEYALNSMDPNGKVELETVGVKRDGSRFHQLLTFIPIIGEQFGAYSGHFCFMQDISDRKQAELELRNANEELEAFAYRTSHDLRSPLVSTEGLLALTKRLLAKGQLESAGTAIDKCSSSIAKLQTTIDDILSLSRNAHLGEVPAPVDLRELIDDVVQQLSHHDGFALCCFDICLKHDGDIVTVETRLQQIFLNLISNALKYSDPELDHPMVTVFSRSVEDLLEIVVEDNGLGIPEPSRDKLFGMFQRFHSHTSYGSGLGLYLVRKNIEALGGSIRFEAPEKGTRFVLSIPQRMIGE